jgi:hypothetical protein
MIFVDFHEVEREYLGWIDLAQVSGRWQMLANAVMDLRAPQNAGNFLNSRGTSGFSGRVLSYGVITN